jgi:hypothetical protein
LCRIVRHLGSGIVSTQLSVCFRRALSDDSKWTRSKSTKLLNAQTSVRSSKK